MRTRAIANAFKYGLLPSRVYEDECHYAPLGYFGHLGMNLALAWRWLTFAETAKDREFEETTNA